MKLSEFNRHDKALISGYVVLQCLWLLKFFSQFLLLKNTYHKILIKTVIATGLFDKDFYLDKNHDVAGDGIMPERHFAIYGDVEGRKPMILFSPKYYRSKARSYLVSVNSLLHYYYIGQHRRLSPSPWFDVQYYLSNNLDVWNAGVEPITHYLHWGGVEGRSPNPQFDSLYYLSEHSEVADAKLNPLLHFIEIGRSNGYKARSVESPATLLSHKPDGPQVASSFHYEKMDGRKRLKPAISVIVPVYDDEQATVECIQSILNSRNETPYQIVVVDDASPIPALSEKLQALANDGVIKLIINDSNLGFVKSVNKALAFSRGTDVILLNSDTKVFNDWIDRLYEIGNNKMVASVTPFSNNATILSYPRTLHDNPYPLEIDYADIDAIAKVDNKGMLQEIPTAVGFCMYMNQHAIEEIGLFDEISFGKGYGEENDWCARASQKGYRHLAATNVYVYHRGGASFGSERHKLIAKAMKTLARKHSDYHTKISEFINLDPLKPCRMNLDLGRLRYQAKTSNRLMVCHARGGGAEKHLLEDVEIARSHGESVFFLRPVRGDPENVRIQHPYCKQLINLPSFKLENTDRLGYYLKKLSITTIHKHGLVDFTSDAPSFIVKLCSYLNAQLVVDIHDYKVICPRINLVDADGFYCGEPGQDACNICLDKNGSSFKIQDISSWRRTHHDALVAADAIVAPSYDVRQRLLKYYPDLNIDVVPHAKPEIPKHIVINEADGSPVNVVVIGAIGYIKGYNALLKLAELIRWSNLPINIHLMGYSANDEKLEQVGVQVTGRYIDAHALDLLHDLKPDIVLIPSTWPETYSYVLDIAILAGYPILAFDIGAIPERLNACGYPMYKVLPLNTARHPDVLSTQILKFYRDIQNQTKLLELA